MRARKAVALSVLGLWLSFAIACGNNKPFDAAAWQKANARDRGRMAESLVKGQMLVGKTVDDVQRILGQADIDYGKALQYNIDLGWLFKDPKHYGLQVHLDGNRTVTLVKIVD